MKTENLSKRDGITKRALIWSLLWLWPLVGQGEPEGGVYELSPVEVLGRGEKLFETPGSGYKLDGLELEAFQVDDINRLLGRVPGVYIREEDGFGLIANISLRGVDTSRSAKVTLMEDGVPTAPAPYSAPEAYYTPLLGRMSGVEVLKGSSQVRYGPHTTGGVVNYLSTPLPGRKAGYVKVAAGTQGELQGHAWLGERWQTEAGTVDALVEGYYRENNGWQRIDAAGDYTGSGETGFERWDSMVKVGWSSTDGRHRVEAKAGTAGLQADLSYLGLSDSDFAADPFRRYAASRLDVFDTEHDRTLISYQWRGEGNWELSWKSYYNRFHRNWYKLNDIRDLDLDGDGIVEGAQGKAPVRMDLSAAVGGAAGGTGLEALQGERAASLRVRANNRSYYLAGTELNVRGWFDAGDWQHSPLMGVRFHRDSIRRFQWHDLYAQAADGSWGLPVTSPRGSDGNRRQETRASALFLENEMTHGRWTLLPGIRFEFLDQRYETFSADGNNQSTGRGSGDMTVWSGGMGVSYRIDPQSAAFFNIYRGFSVPDPISAITDDISEETSNSVELGYRFRDEASGLNAEVVAFTTAYHDLIVIDNIGSGGGTGAQQPVTENIGEVRSYGIEFLMTGLLAEAGDGSWRMPASLAATWTVAELDGDSRSTDAESIFAGGSDGTPLPYIPEFTVNVNLSLEWERWSTGFAASYRDSTPSTATDATEPVNPLTGGEDARYGRIDSIFLVDWNLHYQVSEEVSLFLTVNNVFDAEHLVSRHPHGPRPGAPRTAMVGLTMHY